MSWLIGIFVTLIVCGIVTIVYYRAVSETQVGETVSTSEDDPILKLLSEQRTEILEETVYCIGSVFDHAIKEQEILVRNVGNNENLITISFGRNHFRLYANWSKNRLKLQYTYDFKTKSLKNIAVSKKFKIKDNFLDYVKIEKFLKKCLSIETAVVLNRSNQIAIAQQMVKSNKLTEEDYEKMLLNYWNKVIDIKKIDNIYLTAYVIHNFLSDLEEDKEDATGGEKNE